MIFFGSGLSDSNTHSHLKLPLVVAGGQFKGNRHVQFDGLPAANLWMTVADKAGAHVENIGNSTGALEL